MNKQDLAILEQAFAREIAGGILQRKSKRVKALAEKGLLEFVSRTDGTGWLKVMYEGYELTHAGRLLFCQNCVDDDHVL